MATAETSLGAPVLVVGHSAGGLDARLLTSPVPFRGRRLNGAGRIGAIVTLGTPHHVRDGGRLGARVGAEAVTFANAVVPEGHYLSSRRAAEAEKLSLVQQGPQCVEGCSLHRPAQDVGPFGR